MKHLRWTLLVFLATWMLAEQTKTIYNPFSQKLDYITVLSSATIPSGSNHYIQNRETLQSGATFNVSSGTVNTSFQVPYLTSGECVQSGSDGKLVSSGGMCGGGGGGSSSLQITQSGVQITSPTMSMNFNGSVFSLAAVGSTATIALNSSSVTLQGNSLLISNMLTQSSATATYLQKSSATVTYAHLNNVIGLQETLQEGASFYVSSGSVAGEFTVGGNIHLGDTQKVVFDTSGEVWMKYSPDHNGFVFRSDGADNVDFNAIGKLSFWSNTLADGSGTYLPGFLMSIPSNPVKEDSMMWIAGPNGQVHIGHDSSEDFDGSAVLEVFSTTQGFLPPRLTTMQRDAIAAPGTGLQIYNTDDNQLQIYDGAVWVGVTGSDSSSVFATTGTTSGYTGDPVTPSLGGIVANSTQFQAQNLDSATFYFQINTSSITAVGPTVDLSGVEATGTLAAARFPALTGAVTTSAGSLATTLNPNQTQTVTWASSQTITAPDGLGVTYGVTAGSVTVNNLTASQLVVTDGNKQLASQSQISDTQIAAGAVDGGLGGEIADDSVTADDLAADSVSSSELNATGVEAELEAVIDLNDLQAQITDTQIADGAVDGGTGGEIADGSITPADLGTDSVSADELNATGVESELEAVLDIDQLQGTITTGQLPTTVVYTNTNQTISGVKTVTSSLTVTSTDGMGVTYGVVAGSVTVADDAYAAGWNGSLLVPTKNAVYDKIETLGAGSGDNLGNGTGNFGVVATTAAFTTSLNLPSGANPTVDAAGEIAFDTTDGAVVAFNGTEAFVVGNATHCVSMNMFDLGGFSSVNEPVWTAPPDMAVTITQIYAASLLSGTTIIFQLDESTGTFTTPGVNVFSVDYSTANYTGVTYNSFSNASIAAGNTLVLNTPPNADTGLNALTLYLQICYKRERE